LDTYPLTPSLKGRGIKVLLFVMHFGPTKNQNQSASTLKKRAVKVPSFQGRDLGLGKTVIIVSNVFIQIKEIQNISD
jgi:hypothetical protein